MQRQIELGQRVLKGVSRSFYLTIRILPRLMREPVSLGYLLARASDTLADTEEVPAALRKACLEKFVPALKDKAVRSELLGLVANDFVSYQSNPKEKLLLEQLEEVFSWYDTVREWAWQAIASVLEHICRGQMRDIEHFAVDDHGQLDSAEELERYCYEVAGCVGEFWTEVGFRSTNRFSSLDRDELDRLGKEFGMGLQLVNILRDVPEDLHNGRCYLPVSDPQNREALMKEAAKWRETARRYIASGIRYATSLRQKRTRVATLLPALIAERTLDLLDEADWDSLEARVKVTRKEVRKCLFKAIFR